CAAAARTGGTERWIVGVSDRATDGADAEITERELVEISFAEDHGGAFWHAGRDARIETRMMIHQGTRTAGRGKPKHVDVIFEDDRDAVERAAHMAGCAVRIGRTGFGDGARVQREDCSKVG